MQIRKTEPGMVITHPVTGDQVEIISSEMQCAEQVICWIKLHGRPDKRWDVFRIDTEVERCERCEKASNYDPRHFPSDMCRMGGSHFHCTCNACF